MGSVQTHLHPLRPRWPEIGVTLKWGKTTKWRPLRRCSIWQLIDIQPRIYIITPGRSVRRRLPQQHHLADSIRLLRRPDRVMEGVVGTAPVIRREPAAWHSQCNDLICIFQVYNIALTTDTFQVCRQLRQAYSKICVWLVFLETYFGSAFFSVFDDYYRFLAWQHYLTSLWLKVSTSPYLVRCWHSPTSMCILRVNPTGRLLY